MILENLAIIFLSAGSAFLVLGSIGVVRFPDFYSRTHAMSKPDTMGVILTLMGLALLNGWNLDSIKLVLIVIFVAISNSSTTHALGRAALRTGLKPWVKEKQ
jgi:multicomponent Na+:H+ antiporter subunit G